MRFLILSLGLAVWVAGAAFGQTSTDTGGSFQLPVGQTFKQFEWPLYQGVTLKATFQAVEATGITLNRAEAKQLRIQIYDDGAVTTTVTSPDADLYISEQKMRTKNTVRIERNDMEATSQACEFDQVSKTYILRDHVKVTLKHFDISTGTPGSGGTTSAGAAKTPQPIATTPAAVVPTPADASASMLDSPGGYAATNAAPVATPETK